MARRTADFRPIRPGANVLRDPYVPLVGLCRPNYLISLLSGTDCGASRSACCGPDRDLNRRDIFKENRTAALAEWRQLAA